MKPWSSAHMPETIMPLSNQFALFR